MQYYQRLLVVAITLVGFTSAFYRNPKVRISQRDPKHQRTPRQLPAEPVGAQSLTTPGGAVITYKEPGKDGICETTPGVGSYAGYVTLSPDVHSFFYFFESRSDPANDPITLWLNGGPGSDSLIGLFEELGPCNITLNLTTGLNPYSWSNVSNMLFLSQPLGVGFSYAEKGPASYSEETYDQLNATQAPPDGRWPIQNNTEINTTDLAAIAAWEIIQAFIAGLPQLSSNITSREFNLATESYGGHYGPSFFNYFYNQNELIKNGTSEGVALEMNSLLIINGIIDEYIQAPYYPEFATKNTYNITAYNQSIYDFTQIALYGPVYGCLDQVAYCAFADRSTQLGKAACSEAAIYCGQTVEAPYYQFGDRGTYDIRHPADDPTPPLYLLTEFLNQAFVQEALGVDLNYSLAHTGTDIYYAFETTGDIVYPNFLIDLEEILNNGVRVSLVYGDADYICNWFGGEAVSLATNYTYTEQFNAAGYVPMLVDGVEYGETREYGNFSFTRVYESGHTVPYYQPLAALQLFNRTINGFDSATGTKKVTADLSTNGTAQATHTEPFVALPGTSAAASSSASAAPSGTTLPKLPHWMPRALRNHNYN